MTSKQEIKSATYKHSLLAFLGLAVAIIVTAATSRVVASVLEHQEYYQFLAQALDDEAAQPSVIEWQSPERINGREFTEMDRRIVGERLSEAWHHLILANRSGDPAFLEEHFDGPALVQTTALLDNRRETQEKSLVVISQKPRARFFHLDGSLLEIASDETITLRYALNKADKRLDFLELARECTRDILVLHSIGWKIRNHESDCHAPVEKRGPYANRRDPGLPLKGINYYPSDTPWLDFWRAFDAGTIEADLSLIANLGANSIRIFLPFDYFYADATRRKAEQRLDHFLFLANQQKLDVIPTLFDFRNSYDPTGYAAEYRYLKNVVKVLRRYENVRLIDLKNEPDLDYEFAGKVRVDMWLEVFSDLLHNLAPELNATIGWLDYRNAAAAADIVDVVSYHEYGDPTGSADRYASVKSKSGGRPVIVSELGKPSWSLALGLPFSRASQSDWTSGQLAALGNSDGVMIWTLHDFSFEAAGKVANLPWRKAMQATYGLYDRNGKPKPVAEVFRNFIIKQNWSIQ